jgi:hypothetical protein
MCSSISPITELPFIQILGQKIKQRKGISAAIFLQKLADLATLHFIKKAVIRI